MDRRISVRAIILKDKQLFVVRNKDKQGNAQRFLNLVGGKLEKNESLLDGIKREIIEETGITPVIGSLLFVQQFSENITEPREYLEFFFNVENVNDFDNIDFLKTSHGELELAEAKFVSPRDNDEIFPIFLRSIDLEGFVRLGKTQIFSYLG